MRRQIGSENGKAISKSISKAKKNKHSTTHQHELKEKKVDREIFKAIYHQSSIKQLSFIFSQLDEHRLNQKLAQIQMFAEKVLDSEQKKKLEEMTSILVQEQRIHNLIELYLKQNNNEKVKQQSEMMKRIQERKKIFFKQSLNRCQAITMNSGVFTNELIAREGSPKMKLQVMGFSDFSKKVISKKQTDYTLELRNKDLVIKRLFQRIELLQMTNSKFDRQKNFKQNMQSINTKYVQSQRKNMKMTREVQQMQNKKEQVINQIQKYRNEYNELLYDYNNLNQKYLDLQRQLKQENTQKQQLEKKNKEFYRFYNENQQLKHKYQDLQEQFNFLIQQKFELERKYNKILKQTNLHQQKITQLKTKLRQLINYEMPQIRETIRFTQNQFKEFSQLINNFIVEQFTDFSNTILKKYQEIITQQVQKQKQFIQIITSKTKQCQDLSIQTRKQSQKQKYQFDQIVQKTKLCQKLLQMTEVFQMNIKKMKNQHADYRKSVEESKKQRKNRLCFDERTVEQTISSNSFQNLFSITTFQILRYQSFNKKISIRIQTNEQKPNLRIKSSLNQFTYQTNYRNQIKQNGIQTQSNKIQSMRFEIGCQITQQVKQNSTSFVQTDQKITKQAEVQCVLFQKVSVFTQTSQKNRFIQQNVISLFLEGVKVQNLQLKNQIQIHIQNSLGFQSIGVQIQEQKIQPPQNYQDFKIIEEQQFNACSQNDIIKMLAVAEECVIVPDIAILKEQIQTYREQIDKLKSVIRQYQKQKQEENVFNFRL